MKKNLAILLATLTLCGALAVGTGAASVEVKSASSIDGKEFYAQRLDGYFEIFVSDNLMGIPNYDPTFEGFYTITLKFLAPWTGMLVLEDAQFVAGKWRRTFAEFRALLPEEDREKWDDAANKTIRLTILLGLPGEEPETTTTTPTTRPTGPTTAPTTTAPTTTKPILTKENDSTWFDGFWKWLAAAFEAILLPLANALASMYSY